MPNFELHQPHKLNDALNLRTERPEAVYVAGGTDMIVNVRRGIEQAMNLVDLTSIQELKKISILQDGFPVRSRNGISTLKTLGVYLQKK